MSSAATDKVGLAAKQHAEAWWYRLQAREGDAWQWNAAGEASDGKHDGSGRQWWIGKQSLS